MPTDELVKSVTRTSTTRRTIVRTGVKLGYAAPLVAASTRLTGGNAFAVSPGLTCAGANACPGPACQSGACSCHPTAEGSSFCEGDTFCSNLSPCTATSECAPGWACVDNCCSGRVCIGPCGTIYATETGTGQTSNG